MIVNGQNVYVLFYLPDLVSSSVVADQITNGIVLSMWVHT